MQAGERAARTMQRLSQLAEIGREGRAGAHRPGLSAAEQEACELVATWRAQEQLEVRWDACGNLSGRLGGTALEAGAQLRDVPRAATLCVAAFRDQEGWRFGEGCCGRRSLCATVTADDLR